MPSVLLLIYFAPGRILVFSCCRERPCSLRQYSEKIYGYKYHIQHKKLHQNISSISHFNFLLFVFFTHFIKSSTSATENIAKQLT